MLFEETPLRGAFLISPERIEDARGFFARAWCRREFEANGLNPEMVQANISYNRSMGTVRGMHYQRAPHEEVKLVRCTRGRMFDVIVDLRKDSETFGTWFGTELSEENRRFIYVPEGFAHGFQTLEDDCEIFYQHSVYYTPGFAAGLLWNDPSLAIDWPIKHTPVISEQDQGWAPFDQAKL